jgi:hypothetical protein
MFGLGAFYERDAARERTDFAFEDAGHDSAAIRDFTAPGDFRRRGADARRLCYAAVLLQGRCFLDTLHALKVKKSLELAVGKAKFRFLSFFPNEFREEKKVCRNVFNAYRVTSE